MGIDPFALQSPHMAKLLDPAERKKLGVQTPEQAHAKHASREEKLMHKAVSSFCRLHGICAYHSRMDRKSGLHLGLFDFGLLYRGKGVALELKCPGQKLRPEQQQVLAELVNSGVPYCVATSSAEAIQFIISELLT